MTRAILDRDATRLRAIVLPWLDGAPLTPEAEAEVRRILTPSTFVWPVEGAPADLARPAREEWPGGLRTAEAYPLAHLAEDPLLRFAGVQRD